jgi:hypothetical protein
MRVRVAGKSTVNLYYFSSNDAASENQTRRFRGLVYRQRTHDIATVTNKPPVDSEEISGGVFEIVPGLKVPYAKVSLQEFSAATGLSKSAVASAIKEAIAVGILERRRHRAPHHGDLPSLYRLNWDRLMESAKARKQPQKVRSVGSARQRHRGA